MTHYAKVESGLVTQVIVADSKEWCQANLGLGGFKDKESILKSALIYLSNYRNEEIN